ncbi:MULTISPECIES: sulfite exporter TauE/SafE family protein [unclassified Devosia]|uniref:sulfite exporter TauE/SafE family protein n=1 Tax=unclassified Devosia TaxID=196773 RepID=UPI00145E6633|nr:MULTISPECIES: sulfite exporter TauE/SafE family protein [unclassified Devosia]MBJ6986176.1 sulfite exporter TauE/SafE family protein [Devosia sp. MC521]QMW64337.1 sulfite exporter TauE/SafE family protein [Devosia sp. MC521]
MEFFADYGLFVVAMIFAGLMGGLVAGLLGVGGGIIIVPVLYFVLGGLGIDEGLRMKIAVATSLTTIIFTSLSSARSHYKKGAVDFDLIKSWSLPIVIGVIAGAIFSAYVSGIVLTAIFAVVALLVAINMTLRANSPAVATDFPHPALKAAFGTVVGLISSLMGIGGGTLSVPILTTFGYDIRKAVGTASALGFVIAIPGTIGYIITGFGAEGLPAGSIGYLNLIALVALIPLTMLVAPYGAKLAHSIPRKTLSYSFAAFLTLTALRMGWDVIQNIWL